MDASEPKNKIPTLAIVMPCYNEELTLPKTLEKLDLLLNRLSNLKIIRDNSFILAVDDGSQDKTWDILTYNHLRNNNIRGLRLSHNVGQQNALLAGLLRAKEAADCIISMDADLQDDIGIVEKFLSAYQQGNEIVYGVRNSRHRDAWLKQATARMFYRFMALMGADIIVNHAEYRLTSKRVLDCLGMFPEVNLFLRGIFPLIGFRSTTVFYERGERVAGKSKYSIKKMASLAMDGITSFSIKPLRFVSLTGFLIFFLSAGLGFYVFIETIATQKTIPGWASTVLPIYFLGGIQILCIGIIGEYIGKIYKETKRRPRYFISEEIY